MTPANLARQKAIPLEVKKDGMRQTQSGDWKITFTVQAADMDQRLTSAAMGTRFQIALVEIGDDELPKQKGKMEWRELQPAAQAGIRCEDRVFWAFLNIEHCSPESPLIQNKEDAAHVTRTICNVQSRAELSTNHKARVLWHQLDEHFQVWKHVNA
jgi:hypothetical protein